MKVSIIVPSYGRPNYLRACVDALDRQTRPADEIIVVCRNTDLDTLKFAHRWQRQAGGPVKVVVQVAQPGQIAALRAGHRAASGDVVVFTDDDTMAYPDWILRMIKYYDDPSIGGVGGKDIIQALSRDGTSNRVGTMTWYGRLIGNHHLGIGPARDVDVLKGANTSFRSHLVEFPTCFRGPGAEVHNEVYVCLRIRRMGYRLVYDPNILVDHLVAPRPESSIRHSTRRSDIRDAAFNFSCAAMAFLPVHRKLIRFLYVTCIGERGSPGIVRLLVGWIRGERDIYDAYVPAQIGHMEGVLFRIKGMHKDGELRRKWNRRTKPRLP